MKSTLPQSANVVFPVVVGIKADRLPIKSTQEGDSELCGTAIECSLNGTFQIILHKKADLVGTALEALDYPMLETKEEWLVHGFSFANYLSELGDKAQSDIYSKSSVDLALRDAFRKMRKFLMTTKKLTEDEAISLITIGVDFGITQVVDGNWGVHAVIKKDLFAGGET
jgi:acetamidase/formamidase